MRFFRLDDDHPLTGWHMLAIVCLFFGTIIAVNAVMAFAATGTFPGLVVENSYVASQHYDELLEKAREQDRAGWRHDLSLEDGIIHFNLATGAGTPASGLVVSAHAGRPSTMREDRSIKFIPRGDGSYVAREPLPPGLWEIDLQAQGETDVVFRRTQEVFVKPGEARR